jgi:hypothetical protein
VRFILRNGGVSGWCSEWSVWDTAGEGQITLAQRCKSGASLKGATEDGADAVRTCRTLASPSADHRSTCDLSSSVSQMGCGQEYQKVALVATLDGIKFTGAEFLPTCRTSHARSFPLVKIRA